jgi:hypothetical protein
VRPAFAGVHDELDFLEGLNLRGLELKLDLWIQVRKGCRIVGTLTCGESDYERCGHKPQ